MSNLAAFAQGVKKSRPFLEKNNLEQRAHKSEASKNMGAPFFWKKIDTARKTLGLLENDTDREGAKKKGTARKTLGLLEKYTDRVGGKNQTRRGTTSDFFENDTYRVGIRGQTRPGKTSNFWKWYIWRGCHMQDT